jgi:ketosteroid isomerase-like protein
MIFEIKKMNTLLEKISTINDMILERKALEAFDQFYHDDIVMQENDNPIVEEKAVNRQREEDFFEAITEFRVAQPLKVTIAENITMVEWHFDYTHKDWGIKNYTQVVVQDWKDGKIIKEKFYYGV